MGGGNLRYFEDFIFFLKRDFEIDVYSDSTNRFYSKRKDDVNIFILKKNFYFKSIWLQRIAKYFFILKFIRFIYIVIINFFELRRIRPDFIFLCNGGFPGDYNVSCLIVASRILGVKSILGVTSVPITRPAYFYLSHTVLNYVVRISISKLIVNSEYQKRVFVEQLRFPSNLIDIIYNAIEYDESIKDIGGRVSNFRIDDVVYFGYIGRLDKLKGVDILIKAIAHSRHREKVLLKIYGTGPEYDAIKNLIVNLHLEKQVLAIGFDHRNAKEIFSEFDVFVFPSLWEGMPYSIIEAIFNNKIIISSKVGGIGEVLVHRHNSLLLEEVTVENINNVIDLVFENKSLFEYLKSYKFNNEQRMFDYLQMEHRVLNVFHRFVGNH